MKSLLSILIPFIFIACEYKEIATPNERKDAKAVRISTIEENSIQFQQRDIIERVREIVEEHDRSENHIIERNSEIISNNNQKESNQFELRPTINKNFDEKIDERLANILRQIESDLYDDLSRQIENGLISNELSSLVADEISAIIDAMINDIFNMMDDMTDINNWAVSATVRGNLTFYDNDPMTDLASDVGDMNKSGLDQPAINHEYHGGRAFLEFIEWLFGEKDDDDNKKDEEGPENEDDDTADPDEEDTETGEDSDNGIIWVGPMGDDDGGVGGLPTGPVGGGPSDDDDTDDDDEDQPDDDPDSPDKDEDCDPETDPDCEDPDNDPRDDSDDEFTNIQNLIEDLFLIQNQMMTNVPVETIIYNFPQYQGHLI